MAATKLWCTHCPFRTFPAQTHFHTPLPAREKTGANKSDQWIPEHKTRGRRFQLGLSGTVLVWSWANFSSLECTSLCVSIGIMQTALPLSRGYKPQMKSWLWKYFINYNKLSTHTISYFIVFQLLIIVFWHGRPQILSVLVLSSTQKSGKPIFFIQVYMFLKR